MKQDYYLNISTVKINDELITSNSTQKELLQIKIRKIMQRISNAYKDLLHFTRTIIKSDADVDFSINIEDLEYEYTVNYEKDIPVLSELITLLDLKQINEKDFQLLNELLDYQWDITKDIFDKKLTIDRIELVYNHLLNVPHYLKADLEIEKLPNLHMTDLSIDSQVYKSKITDYNLKNESKFYVIGA